MKQLFTKTFVSALSLLTLASVSTVSASESTDSTKEPVIRTELQLRETPFLTAPAMSQLPQKFFYDSGVNIAYPEDGVKGIYLTAYSAGNPQKLDDLVAYINSTDLNAMVIDIKDDHGYVTTDFQSDNAHIQNNTIDYIQDIGAFMKKMEEMTSTLFAISGKLCPMPDASDTVAA